ncbi:helix-turn-helix domain-containing protein [Streptomyces sp. NPDC057424]|uniref:helix-turn-helix domain-containing protein n=1 Tax=Streptomyces sp. NPDC057424 TaxID=3346127 RepID=UPI0036958338
MTRNDLAPPTAVSEGEFTTAVDTMLILRLASVVEQLASQQAVESLELRCFTPEEAAEILGKTENWVADQIRARRIPFTYVGRTPRLTAAHIRQIQAQGEVLPHKYAKPVAAKTPARAAA